MVWGAWAVIFAACLVWGFEPLRSRAARTMLGIVCFLVAAGAASVALERAGTVVVVGGSVLAAAAGFAVASLARRTRSERE
ncbi:hypothetical protein [Demequina salsinemoris]|uniref:hypothetical protein n=1 Tax=Demequina salsinemoris TaxID=577470 RepID=UPI000783A390|nr:hypothetical protein [Demequina salsinemoris]